MKSRIGVEEQWVTIPVLDADFAPSTVMAGLDPATQLHPPECGMVRLGPGVKPGDDD